MTDHDAEVLIAGGGPVGLGLAIELGQRGVRGTVVERHETLHRIPKGQNLTQRTVEHFHFWGVKDAVAAARRIPKEFGIAGLTAYGTLLGDYSYDWFRRAAVRPFYFTDNDRLPQYDLEKALRDRAAEIPEIEILYGWTVDEIGQDEDGTTIRISETDGVERRTLSGRWLVGCDGSRSVVREQAGIALDTDDHDKRMVLLVFRSTELHELLERYPGKSYFNVVNPAYDGYWQFFGRVDPGKTWFFHCPVPADTTKENFDFEALLHQAVGQPFELTLEHVGFWDLRIASARAYRTGRVLIAGDAAHSHPPYGGFGINTGFEDAANLGWKLAAIQAGWGGPALLDSYDGERRPVFVSTGRDFIGRMIADDKAFLERFDPERDKAAFEAEWARRGSGGDDDVTGFEPNYEGSAVVFADGAPSARGRHRVEARAGHHLAPQVLASGENIYERLGPGFTLFAQSAAKVDAEAFRAAATRADIPLEIVLDDGEEAAAAYRAKLVLIRPDQFVAWEGDAVGPSPEKILRRATGWP